MFQPADRQLGDQTMQPGPSGLVGVDFGSGSKKHFVLTEVQDSIVDAFFALSMKNKTDTRAIVSMLGQEQMRAVPAGKDPAIRDLLNI